MTNRGLHRAIPLVLGVVAVCFVVALLFWEAAPSLFPFNSAHDVLGAIPLALVGFAYLAYVSVRHPSAAQMFKAVLLWLAFLFWAANQYWPNGARTTLYNDLAITLFVLDLFLVIIGWPKRSPDPFQ